MLKANHGFSFVAAVFVLLFVACSDDDSDFATRPSEGSSSSVCENCDESSSSSVTPQSSDSETSVSSSSVKSSSSVAFSSSTKSSSSEKAESSSSKVTEPVEVTIGTMTDSRDGQTYKTVTIGTQTWMAQNLNYETANSYCYKDSASYCTKYGRLYTWAAAMDSVGIWSTNGKGCGRVTTCSPTYPVRGVCPEGWHLPTEEEFETLFAVVGRSIAGQKLKSTSGWNDYRGRSGNGTDAFAFSALPAGHRGSENYYDEGNNADFWGSTEYGSYDAYHVRLRYSNDGAYLGYISKYDGYSVRCLKDEGETVQSSSSVTPQSSDSETSMSSSSVKSSSSVAFSSSTKSSSSEKAESSSSKVTEPAEVTSGTMTDSRDGQTYKTVTIGTQTWMAQNLNYAYTDVPYKNGDYTSDSTSWCYNDDASNCSKYGRLYTWAAAMDSVGTWSTNGKGCGYTKTCSPTYPVRGVCPEGWHLPDSTEWATLFTAVGGQSTAGKMLKSTSGWNDYVGESGNGTDAFAFSALPVGGRNEGGGYNGEGNGALFWSSAEGNSGSAYFMDLYFGHSYASLYSGDKNYGFSVRCLKD